jgi:hypothetical protein
MGVCKIQSTAQGRNQVVSASFVEVCLIIDDPNCVAAVRCAFGNNERGPTNDSRRDSNQSMCVHPAGNSIESESTIL